MDTKVVPLKVLIVCMSPEAAERRRQEMDHPENYYFTSITGMLGGRRFDKIILDDINLDEVPSVIHREIMQKWITGHLPTKLGVKNEGIWSMLRYQDPGTS